MNLNKDVKEATWGEIIAVVVVGLLPGALLALVLW
jgi:hypothetical protein